MIQTSVKPRDIVIVPYKLLVSILRVTIILKNLKRRNNVFVMFLKKLKLILSLRTCTVVHIFFFSFLISHYTATLGLNY